MKIGVVSDTHSHDIPAQLIADFQDVDMIIHAGDFCSLEDYQVFEKIADTQAVFGNMDDADIRKKLPEVRELEYEGIKIGVYHGDGARHGIIERILSRFTKNKPDIIIYGHTHNPMNEVIDGIHFFNPGSPNDTVAAPYCSYGILEINNGKFKTQIIKVKN